jgi:hypothetical protein
MDTTQEIVGEIRKIAGAFSSPKQDVDDRILEMETKVTSLESSVNEVKSVSNSFLML